jgi:hypothetical protein
MFLDYNHKSITITTKRNFVAWRPHNPNNQQNALVLYMRYQSGSIKRDHFCLCGHQFCIKEQTGEQHT